MSSSGGRCPAVLGCSGVDCLLMAERSCSWSVAAAGSAGGAGCGGGVSQAADAEDGGAFVFGHAAPDAVGFAGFQGPGGAVVDDGAVLADLFGLVDPGGLVPAAFPGGVVEDLDVQAAAGGEQLPVPFLGHRLGGLVLDGGHLRSPFGLQSAKRGRAWRGPDTEKVAQVSSGRGVVGRRSRRGPDLDTVSGPEPRGRCCVTSGRRGPW